MTTTDKLVDLLRQRHASGLAKYGVTVDRTDLTPDKWAEHAIEEMLDGAAYLMRLREEMAKKDERIAQLEQDLESAKKDAQSWEKQSDMLATDAVEYLSNIQNAKKRIADLKKAGDAMQIAANRADDDIREHLQVANYNLHGLLNTGERIDKPNPPQTIHQAGINASVLVRKMLRESVIEWVKVKEAKGIAGWLDQNDQQVAAWLNMRRKKALAIANALPEVKL